jgi:hypothetical protein
VICKYSWIQCGTQCSMCVQAGLKPQMVIQAVNGAAISSIHDYQDKFAYVRPPAGEQCCGEPCGHESRAH